MSQPNYNTQNMTESSSLVLPNPDENVMIANMTDDSIDDVIGAAITDDKESDSDDDTTPEQSLEGITQSLGSSDEALINLLKANNLYHGLYDILHENSFDLETLQKDLPGTEVDTFCKEFGLNYKQKLKFRKLMRIISKLCTMDVVLVGDINGGKTSLLRRYVLNKFTDGNGITSSIGVDCMTKMETLSDESVMKITIWDTAGQERYQSVCRNYYRKADCIIICYDVSIQEPFTTCSKWRDAIERYGADGVVVILVGCKSDLATNEDIHSQNIQTALGIIEQKEWQKFDAMHCECSAKTSHNIKNVFLTVAELVGKRRKIGKGVRFNNQIIRQQNEEISNQLPYRTESRGKSISVSHISEDVQSQLIQERHRSCFC